MEHFVNASLSRGRKKCVNVSVSVCVRVHMWAWLPFGTRWPSNWPCPHSHRPTRTDPAGLNARNTPACQSNPRGGWHSPERACINIQRMCVRVYRPRPWWPPATPFHSAAVRRDLETRDCYYSPADSTHTHTHTHTHTTHTHTNKCTHTDGRAAWNALNNRGTTRIQQYGEAVNSGGDTNTENKNSNSHGNLGGFDFTQRLSG